MPKSNEELIERSKATRSEIADLLRKRDTDLNFEDSFRVSISALTSAACFLARSAFGNNAKAKFLNYVSKIWDESVAKGDYN